MHTFEAFASEIKEQRGWPFCVLSTSSTSELESDEERRRYVIKSLNLDIVFEETSGNCVFYGNDGRFSEMLYKPLIVGVIRVLCFFP